MTKKNIIFSGFQALNTIYHGIRASYDIPLRIMSNLNGLFETVVGRGAPSKGYADIVPHDHTSIGGGRVLARGLVGGFDMGAGGGGGWDRVIQIAEQNTRVRFLDAYTSGVPVRDEYDLGVYVTHGQNGTKNNRHGGLYPLVALEGRVYFWYNNAGQPSGTATIHVKNIDTNTEDSFSVSMVAGGSGYSWRPLYQIPISDNGGRQRYKIDVTSETSASFEMQAFLFWETVDKTQAVSQGTKEYHNANNRL